METGKLYEPVPYEYSSANITFRLKHNGYYEVYKTLCRFLLPISCSRCNLITTLQRVSVTPSRELYNEVLYWLDFFLKPSMNLTMHFIVYAGDPTRMDGFYSRSPPHLPQSVLKRLLGGSGRATNVILCRDGMQRLYRFYLYRTNLGWFLSPPQGFANAEHCWSTLE